MDYTNWATDEPDSDYGEINTSDGTWKTGFRWHDRAYICKTPKGEMIHVVEIYSLFTVMTLIRVAAGLSSFVPVMNH